MNCKNAKQRVLAALVDGTFDPEQGCRWPRDVIAAYAGVSEKTVSRAVAELEREGLRVVRPRKRGECNTYFVPVWNPSLRKRTVARLNETKPIVSRLRQAKCPPKENSSASKGSSAQARTAACTSGPTTLVAREARKAEIRGARRRGNHFERSRGVPEPARRPDLRLVDDPYGIEGLVAECQRLRALVMVAFGLASSLRYERDVAEEDARQERKKGRYKDAQIRRLRKQRQERLAEGANMELIQRLWEFHRKHIPGSHKLGAKTIETVRARLADTAPDSKEPAYSPRYIAEAILGAKDDQWARERGQATLERICSSPESLERFHGQWERRR